MQTRIIAAMGVAVCMTGAAWAADVAAPFYKAPAPVAYDWTGFYAGLHAGYVWSKNTDNVGPANAATALGWLFPGEIGSPVLDASGFIGGAQIGYNFQLAPAWVVGLEADISATTLDKSASVAGIVDPSRVITGTEKMDWLGTVRGRLGVTPADRVLFYVTGGLAYGHAELATALTRTTGCGGNNCQQGSVSAINSGWTVGAGVEWAFANAWSAKLEYLHYDLGHVSHLMTDPSFPATVFNASLALNGDIVRAGVNYRFSAR